MDGFTGKGYLPAIINDAIAGEREGQRETVIEAV
jgi:hypothetical protein